MKRHVALIGITTVFLVGGGLFLLQTPNLDDHSTEERQVAVNKEKISKNSPPEVPVSTPLGRPEIYEKTASVSGGKKISLEQVLRLQLQGSVGREVKFETSLLKRQDNWVFVCGRPLELSGDSFDYSNSKLAKYHAMKMVDDKFCAILDVENETHNIVEFDLGSTDNPYVEWVTQHNLPKGIIE